MREGAQPAATGTGNNNAGERCVAPAEMEAKPGCQAIQRGSLEQPLVRFDDPIARPPNNPWGQFGLRLHSSPWVRWPANVPDHHRGLWLIACPCSLKACTGFVEIVEIDYGASSAWTPARWCSQGCSAIEVAEALVRLIGGTVDSYLPPVVFDEREAKELNYFISSSPAVRAAWKGTGAFRSPRSRVIALGYRLREAGAPPLFADMGAEVLAEKLGIDAGIPVRLVDYERRAKGDVEC